SLSASLAHVLMPLVARLHQQFDLDANPDVIASHLSADPLLATQIDRVSGLRVPGAFDTFELALRAVLGQQVSVAGATTLSGRLVRLCGDAVDTPLAGITHHFPTAERLVEISVTEIAKIGIPLSRAQTVLNLAAFAVQGGL